MNNITKFLCIVSLLIYVPFLGYSQPQREDIETEILSEEDEVRTPLPETTVQDSSESDQDQAVEQDPAKVEFHVGLNAMVLNLYDSQSPADNKNHDFLALRVEPSLSVGDFYIALSLPISLRFPKPTATDKTFVAFRVDDWIPVSGEHIGLIIERYVGLIGNIRYGTVGAENGLYVNFGEVNDFTIGNGAIFRNYTNRNFYPARLPSGTVVEFNSRGFGFPLVGVQAIKSNWSALDLFGVRVYFEPFAGIDAPTINGWHIGATFAADLDPYNYARHTRGWDGTINENADIFLVGMDLRMPIVTEGPNTITAFGDFVISLFGSGNEIFGNHGAQIGVEGELFGFLLYHADVWYGSANVVPAIFNEDYDIYRLGRQEQFFTTGDAGKKGQFSWNSFLGTEFFDELLTFKLFFNGEAGNGETGGTQPKFDLGAEFSLSNKLISWLSINLRYMKNDFTNFGQLLNLDNAIIQTEVQIGIDAVKMVLFYDILYSPYRTTLVTTAGMRIGIEI